MGRYEPLAVSEQTVFPITFKWWCGGLKKLAGCCKDLMYWDVSPAQMRPPPENCVWKPLSREKYLRGRAFPV